MKWQKFMGNVKKLLFFVCSVTEYLIFSLLILLTVYNRHYLESEHEKKNNRELHVIFYHAHLAD